MNKSTIIYYVFGIISICVALWSPWCFFVYPECMSSCVGCGNSRVNLAPFFICNFVTFIFVYLITSGTYELIRTKSKKESEGRCRGE